MKTEEKRESREWWAVTEYGVTKVIGYSCAPSNPTTWWCPEVGYSLHEDYHLFGTEKDALLSAIQQSYIRINSEKAMVDKLHARLRAISV